MPRESNSVTPADRPTICLNMIVKNEAKVIARCLESVKPILDAWVIVDTGSTDGTQTIIRSVMKDIRGELHERPWKDFGHNRTEAIQLARGKGDYLFVIDADDVLAIPPRFAMPKLTKDSYQLRVEDAGTSYLRIHLFRSDLDYYYLGVLHEVLMSAEKRSMGRVDGLVYQRTGGGARSISPNKYRRDAEVLEAALAAEPKNARYAFYLAQSWRDAGELEKAILVYEQRAQMGGWEEEVYFSMHEVAKLSAKLGKDDGLVIDAYLRAYERRPSRAEPLCNLAAFLRDLGRKTAAYPFARAASEIPRPDDLLFVDNSTYAWRSLDEYAVAAYWVGRYKEALAANQRLLASGALPEKERERVQKNMAFCREKLGAAAKTR
jgi:glycosyltransferase involved in cell wall biosynthesis